MVMEAVAESMDHLRWAIVALGALQLLTIGFVGWLARGSEEEDPPSTYVPRRPALAREVRRFRMVAEGFDLREIGGGESHRTAEEILKDVEAALDPPRVHVTGKVSGKVSGKAARRIISGRESIETGRLSDPGIKRL